MRTFSNFDDKFVVLVDYPAGHVDKLAENLRCENVLKSP